mmetsp:Transcript_2730/g.10700  ORF Transcript_2730/g.10700 Transcript_2730/m.10700 type:complete len:116 (-) Transcript_2730:128-475(-)
MASRWNDPPSAGGWHDLRRVDDLSDEDGLEDAPEGHEVCKMVKGAALHVLSVSGAHTSTSPLLPQGCVPAKRRPCFVPVHRCVVVSRGAWLWCTVHHGALGCGVQSCGALACGVL